MKAGLLIMFGLFCVDSRNLANGQKSDPTIGVENTIKHNPYNYLPIENATKVVEILQSMGEPSIYEQRNEKSIQTVRFTYIPTKAKAISFRIYQPKINQYAINVIRLSGPAGYDHGTVELTATVHIPSDQFGLLIERAKLPKIGAPLRELTERQAAFLRGFGGDRWILESLVNGSYSVTSIWGAADLSLLIVTPEMVERVERQIGEEMNFPDLRLFVSYCDHLIALADMKLPERDMTGE